MIWWKKGRALNPPESAGRLAVASVPVAFADDALGAVRNRIMSGRYELLDPVIALDRDGKYLGAAELREVIAGDAAATLRSIMKMDWPHVSPQTDQEHASEAATVSRVAALPVVTDEGQICGCIPPATLLNVLAREHREDMHRLAGILREGSNALHALEDPPFKRVRRRLPWLLAGLALSTAATILMASYEKAMQANVVIAFFIPALVYLTDAIGTQTETIAIRALSIRRRPLASLLLNEMMTGASIGLLLGVLAMASVWAVFADPRLAFGVGISLLVAGTLASTIGLVLPWSLSRIRLDPAFGAGPVGTIVQDVLTILLYFVIMTALLG
jgi:magnesium transporter